MNHAGTLLSLCSVRKWMLTAVTAVFLAATVQAAVVTYEVDPASGRVTRANYPDGSYITYHYDENGNRTEAVVTRVQDTAAPSVPTGLTATAVGGTQVNLSWNASTDNVAVTGYVVERCVGVGCSSFQQIAQPTGTSYSNGALTSALSYSYRVRARDAATNISAPSSVASVTTPDSEPPSAPGTPSISNISGNGATVTFTAATDNVAVTGYWYSLNSGATWIDANTSGTSFNLAGLTSWTTYWVWLRARDAAQLTGPISISAPFVTPDNVIPTAPGNLSAVPSSATQVDLTWNVSTDNRGVGLYRIERCQGPSCSNFAEIAIRLTNNFQDPGRTPGVLYSYRVRAEDLSALLSNYSSIATTNTADIQPPTAPPNLQVGSITATSAVATWDPSTDNAGVPVYDYSLNGGSTWTSASSPQALSGLTNGTNYTLLVRSRDGSGLTSTSSRTFQTIDTTPPGAPPGLSIGSITGTSVVVTWGAATDNVAVTGYEYMFNGGPWTAGSSPLTLSGLTNGTNYSIWVRARDAAGLTSTTPSSAGFSTTDTMPPGTPPGLSIGSITSTSAVASWGAASDNVGVTGYEYSFNGGSWTSGSSPLTLGGLTSGTNYTFAVRARDAAGLTSTPPASTSFWTTDITPPGTPPGLSIGSITATSAVASWGAASDNVGVTGYEYSFNGGSWTSGSSPLALSSLTNGTNYTFAVRARDAAGLTSTPPASTSFWTTDTTPPGSPPGLGIGSITETSAVASWGAASDNVGVTAYEYSFNGGGWTTGTSPVNLTGLSAGTPYSFAVRARDAAGFSSVASSTSFTTLDSTPPSAPGSLAISDIRHSSVVATWSAATDNVGVTSYEYSTNGGANWTNAGLALSATITGLSPNTGYTVQVRARDAQGNAGSVRSGSVTTIAQVTIGHLNVSTHMSAFVSVAHYQLTSAGEIMTSMSNSSALIDVGDWLAPKSGMGNFQMRQATGNCTNGPPVGTWVSSGNWSVTVGSPQTGVSCSMTIEIRSVGNPSVILGTAFITLQATRS